MSPLCVVCYRELPHYREVPPRTVGVQCACGCKYAITMIHAYFTNTDFRKHWQEILRRDGWTVEFNAHTGEVVVTNG